MRGGHGETMVDVAGDVLSLPEDEGSGHVSEEIPEGPAWRFEPDWDGLGVSALIGVDRASLVSDRGRSFDRYFPEVVRSLRVLGDEDAVVRGSLIVMGNRGFDHGFLRRRLHPSLARVATLETTTPATFVLTDVVVRGSRDLRPLTLVERRRSLEDLAASVGVPVAPASLGRIMPGTPVVLAPLTSDRTIATRWLLDRDAVGRDGVIARHDDGRHWVRVRRMRSVACVVTGFRSSAKGPSSVRLGLYESGRLVEVGRTTMFRRAPVRRAAHRALSTLPTRPYRPESGTAWVDVPPALVCEVRVDRLRGHRFRHAAEFVRWLPGRDPASCTIDQLEPSLAMV
jgi:ATP-dependent DNA ligase